ncbi:uncharacterized protein LOC113330483 [Papaver somniferum]|uniref:uncharacterized protein LOC113330483 n=1 Tax=Papaver somniferum TaxID=3469 RepID=UPI000E705FF6|nr:uncharacterized protein LOC113330483 [Papaver somniferum]
MRVFYWNAQGLSKDGGRAKLNELSFLHKPDVICIAEPHIFCTARFVRSLKLVDFCEDVIKNEVDGEKGNFWILWRNTLLRPDILSTPKQAITVKFAGDFIAAVYASYNPVAIKRLWHQLGLGFISIPWLVLGYFNCVLRLEENKGEGLSKRSGAQRIVSKHDIVVVNDAWCYKYANWRCKALPRVCSDHSPLFGFAFENPRPYRVPFRIQKMWLSHPGFMQLVEENWNLDLNGAPPFAELKLETENGLLDYDSADEFQFLKVADAKKVVDDVRTELAIMLKMKSRDEIKDFIVNHYQAKFNGGDVHIDPVLFDIEHESISVAESAYMDAIPSLEEVRVAVFDLGADSAPGPDGFTGSFYRQFWEIISRDLFNAIANCWSMRKIPNGINSSFIFLIPKNNKSDAIKDYRSIGLSNFFFKIITKIMDTRLGTVLNKLISEEQVEFMKGRNIHENIALASELINEINTERKHGKVGLKLDIAQAFDTVSWDFIAEVFRQYGFSDSWCMWVLNIFSSARISVMINVYREGYFSITRGLRQGDPLSPLIIFLIEDVLSHNFSKLFANHSMNVMVSKKGVAPTHLLFADDILIFCRGNLHSLQNLKNMLVLYEHASGQCVNYAKSKFYFGGDIISRAIVISNYLGMERAMFPDKYLGIQLKPGIVRHIHVRQVVEKIMNKLAGWKGKLLSFQARLVLIKSVISSYVIHSMAFYKWPCTVIKQVERAIRNFLWSGDAEKRKYFTFLYDDLCLSKREGGLGIKKLNDVNRAMLMKLWISIRDSNKIWARFLRAKYFKVNGNLINYKLASLVFPGIRLVYNFVQKHTGSIIGPNDFKSKVSDIIFDGVWVIPEKTRDLMIRCNIDVSNLPVIAGGEDYKIWYLDSEGIFSVKSAKAALKTPAEVVPCAHLVARRIWAWVAGIFKLEPSEDLVDSYKAAKGRRRMIKDLWLVANLAIVTELWKLPNKSYFDNMALQWLVFKGRVYQVIRDNSIRMKGHMYNTLEELRILNYFKVRHRSCKTSTPIEISWTPPNQDEIMICCDGASFGNPGQAGSVVVFCDASSEVLGVLCVDLGWQTNFYVEVCAIIYGVIVAKRWNMRSICIHSDSKSCIQAFQKGELPW